MIAEDRPTPEPEYTELELSSFIKGDKVCVMEATIEDGSGRIESFVYRTGCKVTEADQPTRRKFKDWQHFESLREALEDLFITPGGDIDDILVLMAQAVMCDKAANVLKGDAA